MSGGPDPLHVTVLGSGNVGATLANRWAEAGHRVTVGRRDPSAPLGTGPRQAGLTLDAAVQVATVADAVAASPTVVVATPAVTLPALLEEHGSALAGRVVIDATNTITGPPNEPHNVAGRMDQPDVWRAHAPDARWYRAFCTLGWENYADPIFPDGPAMLPYGGPDDPEGRAVLDRLSGALGGEPAYLGPLPESAAALDGLTRAWFVLALTRGGGRRLALRVVTAAG